MFDRMQGCIDRGLCVKIKRGWMADEFRLEK